jgi:hypothetical protein
LSFDNADGRNPAPVGKYWKGNIANKGTIRGQSHLYQLVQEFFHPQYVLTTARSSCHAMSQIALMRGMSKSTTPRFQMFPNGDDNNFVVTTTSW